jgi:response regulator NasT
MKDLANEVRSLEEALEARKAVDRAKGLLMDECGMKENDAYSWIRSTAMQQRRKLADIANDVIESGLRPDGV